MNDSTPSKADAAPDRRADRDLAYQRPQPAGMLADVFAAGGLDLDEDETSWVPQAEGVWFKPLFLGVSSGSYVNLLRVRKAGVLSRHRHSGAVHAFTLHGEWHYLEHDWVARAGDYAFEPPGETHTLVVPEHAGEMVTLFHVTGGYTYVDPDGGAIGYEDVFTKREAAARHFEALGIGASYVERFVR